MPPKKKAAPKTATKAAPKSKAAPKAKAAPKRATTNAAATRALTAFEDRFTKAFGADTLQRTDVINPYEVISTGSLALDYALGVGGFVMGRLNEIWGPEGTGKTRLLLMHLAEAQRAYPDKYVAMIDVENRVDRSWAARHGIDLTRFYLYHPRVAEDVADALKEMIRSGIMVAIGVDSVGAMLPTTEMDKEAGEAVMGDGAKIVTRMVKIAAAEARQHNVAVTLINQVRANLSYGADTTTGGGFALKHATTHKLRVRRTGTTPFKTTVGGESGVVVGHEIAVMVERNGVAPAYRTANLVWYNQDTEKYGPMGLDKADETVSLGITTRVIKQAGAYYDAPNGQRVQGRAALLDLVRGDLTLQDQIREQVLATVASTVREDEIEPDAIDDGPVDTTELDTTAKPTFRKSGEIDKD